MKKLIWMVCLLMMPFISCQAEDVDILGPCEPYRLEASTVEQDDFQYTLAFAHGNERIYVDRSSCHAYAIGQETCYACIAVRVVEEEDGDTCEPFVMQFKENEDSWYYQEGEEDGPWIPLLFLDTEQKEASIEDMGYTLYLLQYHVVAAEVLKIVFSEVEGRTLVTGER